MRAREGRHVEEDLHSTGAELSKSVLPPIHAHTHTHAANRKFERPHSLKAENREKYLKELRGNREDVGCRGDKLHSCWLFTDDGLVIFSAPEVCSALRP